MLNLPLYMALKALFKTVNIVNDGVHARIVPDSRSNGEWTIEGEHGEQYVVNCPFCKDHKKHLYISYLSYIKPVAEGYTLKVGHLKAKCFRSDCMKDKDNVNFLEGQIGLAMAVMDPAGKTELCMPIDINESSCASDSIIKTSTDTSIAGIRTWVPDFNIIDEKADRGVLEYIEKRRITNEDVKWLNIGWGPIKSPRTGEYINDGKPWIIFPIINNNKLIGVQARCPSIYLKEGGLRYWFHPGCRKSTLLYNIDIARNIGCGVVCEGVFDVISVGIPGVCTFGHTPSTAQKRLLATINDCLIWLPDTDIREDLDTISIANTHVTEYNKSGVYKLGAHVVVLPKKDAGELTRQEVWAEILKQVPVKVQDYLLDRVVPLL